MAQNSQYNLVFRLVSWLLSTSIFAAACALSLTLASEKLLSGRLLPVLSPLHLLVAGCTLLEYNVHYMLHSGGLLVNAAAKPVYPRAWHWLLCIGGAVMCLAALPTLPVNLILLLLILGAMALAYSAPKLPFRPKRNINDRGVTKITVLTATWVAVTTVFPALFLHLSWNAAGAELLWRVLLIFPLCLAFDLRDVQVDQQYGVQTLAVTLGATRSYQLAYGSLVLLIAGVCFYLPAYRHLLSIIIAAVIALLVIFYSRIRPHAFVYLGLIDGVMLLYGLLVLAE